jgi:hypothetical protein
MRIFVELEVCDNFQDLPSKNAQQQELARLVDSGTWGWHYASRFKPQVPTPSSAVAWRVPDECTERLAKARAALANAAVNYRDPCNLTQARAIDKASEELEAAAIENRAFTTPVPDEAVRRLVREAIAGVLWGFRCQHTQDAEGTHSLLVDKLTPEADATIERGQQEVELLIDDLTAHVNDALRAFIGSEK